MGLDDRFKHIGHFRLLFLSGDSTPPNGSHRPWRFPFGGSIAPSVVRAGRTRILPVRSASGRSWPDSAPTWAGGPFAATPRPARGVVFRLRPRDRRRLRLLARLPAATNDERHLDAVRRGMDLDHLPHG